MCLYYKDYLQDILCLILKFMGFFNITGSREINGLFTLFGASVVQWTESMSYKAIKSILSVFT